METLRKIHRHDFFSLSHRRSWAVGLNGRLFGMANMALVFLLHAVHGRFSRVCVISSSSVVSYPDHHELVWDGDRAIFACPLIFVTGGTSISLSVSPLQSIFSPEECLTSFNSFCIWWSWMTPPPPDTWYFEFNKHRGSLFGRLFPCQNCSSHCKAWPMLYLKKKSNVFCWKYIIACKFPVATFVANLHIFKLQ